MSEIIQSLSFSVLFHLVSGTLEKTAKMFFNVAALFSPAMYKHSSYSNSSLALGIVSFLWCECVCVCAMLIGM